MRQKRNLLSIFAISACAAASIVAVSVPSAMPLPDRGAGDDVPTLTTLIQGAEKKGPPGKGGGGPLAAAAQELGISERELANAVGPAPPNIEHGAKVLGISPDKLRAALEKHRPPAKKQ